MSYYPQSGDVEGWTAWYWERHPDYTVDQVLQGLLPIFESDLWCLLSKVRANPSIKRNREALQNTLAFLQFYGRSHGNHEFRQYRETLRRGRFLYAMFNNISTDYPYAEVEAQLSRGTRK